MGAKALIADVLSIGTVEELRECGLPKSWSPLARYRRHYPESAVYKLLDSAGGKTLGESAYILLHGRSSCKICAKNTPFRGVKHGFAPYCSRACVGKDKEYQLSLALKREKTMLERYGARTTLESKILKQKVQSTNLERFGNISAAASTEVREKIKTTVQERFGGNSPNARGDIKDKQSTVQRKNADLKKIRLAEAHGFTLLSGDVLGSSPSTWSCAVGHVFQHKWLTAQIMPICRTCVPYVRGTSAQELELAKFVQSLLPIQQNHRIYTSKKEYREIDVYVPLKNIGFEYNGLYWHSEQAGKGKAYHLKKLELAEDTGIHLIQIFEHEWKQKREICESIIRGSLGLCDIEISASTLELKEVPEADAGAFLSRTHILGTAEFTKAFGLYLGSALISCAGWRKDRFGAMELIRFSSELNYAIPDALSKLTDAAHCEWRSAPLKYFCDRRHGNGNDYTESGWVQVGESSPGYWYFDKNHQVIHRLKLQKKTLLQSLCYDNKEPVKLTEWDLAQLAGYNRFWDCGNLIFMKAAHE